MFKCHTIFKCSSPHLFKCFTDKISVVSRHLSAEDAAKLIHDKGLKLYGAALSDRARDIRDIELDNAVVAIGSEGRGLSGELLALCDGELIIPMAEGSESLNAAIAASIVLWEMAR